MWLQNSLCKFWHIRRCLHKNHLEKTAIHFPLKRILCEAIFDFK